MPANDDYKIFANKLPILCWTADETGWIYWYNNKWYEYTNTTPDQMAGWGWQSVHDPKVLPLVMIKWQNCIDTGIPFEMTFPLKRGDGTWHKFLTLADPEVVNGKVVGWYGVNIDITKQAEAEEKLIECNQKNIEILNGICVIIDKKLKEI